MTIVSVSAQIKYYVRNRQVSIYPLLHAITNSSIKGNPLEENLTGISHYVCVFRIWQNSIGELQDREREIE